MKQVIQSARSGRLAVKDVPAPNPGAGEILVRTRASLISAGTERMVVEFAKKSLAGKAKARPDLVKKVLAKAKTDGLKATFAAVMARLDEPLPLGYSAAGEVVRVGSGLEGQFRPGDRVAIAGAGVANHAEYCIVPRNLAVAVPAGLDDAHAAFATLGAIALHAVRNLDAKLGECVAVIGAGLIGQLAAQLLNSAGVRAMVLDYDQGRLDLARQLGAEAALNLTEGNAESAALEMTHGLGCDGVLIAAATETSEPFETAAVIARDRARICLVGASGTEFPYAEFMKKELSVVVSRSYGPGRYDADYEQRGHTYPPGFVRWTETENLAECLRLMAAGTGTKGAPRLDVGPMISHRFEIADAEDAYELVLGGEEAHLGVVLTYDQAEAGTAETPTITPAARPGGDKCRIGVIGAGQFAGAVLLPELKKLPAAELCTVVANSGASAEHARESFGFARAATDAAAIFDDGDIDAVIVATRHDSHAEYVQRALAAGKPVLVEKPLGLSRAEIETIAAARASSDAFFQVGFNRRFAPLAQKARAWLETHGGPKFMVLRINAGQVPDDSWIQNRQEGGGRILGEACHFVDLARFFAASPIQSVQADAARIDGGAGDDVTATIRFEDGTLATIAYTALGDAAYPKERFEIYAGGNVLGIDNFRSLTITENGATRNSSSHQDKGFAGALQAFVDAVKSGGPAPIDENESIESSLATIAILESLAAGGRIDLGPRAGSGDGS
jgi:predicted dehydrogenase/threonine dehydrogenase-like Zn-dependent dehydrogenase